MSPTIPTTSRQYCLTKGQGLESLKLEQHPISQLQASEVLVAVKAVSLNFRDLLIPRGQYGVSEILDNLVPASDMAGVVLEVGADVKGWNVGDRVSSNFFPGWQFGEPKPAYAEGAYGAGSHGVMTEYRAFDAASLVKIPDYLSFEEAATLPCAGVTAYQSLLGSVPIKGGDTVLIQGTGGVSVFGIQIAAASGATVIVTSSSDEKLEKAKALGANHFINYKKTPDWELEVLKLTNGEGVDHVLEVGGGNTFEKSTQAVRMGGHIHIVGVLAGLEPPKLNIALTTIGKAFNLHGIQVGSRTTFENLNRLLTARKIHPVVDKVWSFEEAPEAYKQLEGQAFFGKIVIRVAQ